MPRHTKPLTELQIDRARYKSGGPHRLYDGGGLFLQLQPSGAKLWRYRYRYDGAEKLLALGAWPAVSRAAARKARDVAKAQLAAGNDPGEQRKRDRMAIDDAKRNNMEAVALEWFEKRAGQLAPGYSVKLLGRLKNDVFPALGHRPISEIEPPELLAMLRRIEERGAVETAHRVRNSLSMIFRYAIATGRAQRDPAADLRGALSVPDAGHMPTMTDPARIAQLLRDMYGYRGNFTTCAALRIAPLVFVRPGELRLAEWVEFDLVAAEWRIPAARMKLRKAAKRAAPAHIVPLSRQACAMLEDVRSVNGRSKFVFPNTRTKDRGMSDNTVNAALRRLGYEQGEIVGHGFRHMASTLLNECGWSADAIERQLAHKSQGVRAIYNKAEYMPERRKMMQAWADYLDALRNAPQGEPLPMLRGPVG